MLENWLTPVSGDVLESIDHQDYFLKNHVRFFTKSMPDLTKVRLVIVGTNHEQTNPIRKILYSYNYQFSPIKIADIGDLRENKTNVISTVLQELLRGGITPIIVGDVPNEVLGQFQSYFQLKQLSNLLLVEDVIPYTLSKEHTEKDYLNIILKKYKKYLFNCGIIGFQSYLNNPAVNQWMEENFYDYVRLGKIRGNMDIAEAIIRDADLMSFNLNTIRCADAGAVKTVNPNGFYAEEACKLFRYAGLSDKLSSIGIYGYKPNKDNDSKTATLVAQMIWYFMEGFFNRSNDYPVSSENLTEYIVDIQSFDYQLTFWKSKITGRWWMQVPLKTTQQHRRHRLIPCTYEDYQLACNDDLSNRLMNALRRFS